MFLKNRVVWGPVVSRRRRPRCKFLGTWLGTRIRGLKGLGARLHIESLDLATIQQPLDITPIQG